MSSIVVNFPDCATLGSSDPGGRDPHQQDTITVYTENCPAQGDTYTQTMFSTWQFVLMAVIMLAMVVATGMVRYRRHERLQAERIAELNVKHIACPTCGDRYAPEKA